MRDIAVPMPIEVIADLIGIPKTDRDKLHHWSDTMIASDGNYDDIEQMTNAANAFAEYVAYIEDTIEARRKDPQEDLVSVLVNAARRRHARRGLGRRTPPRCRPTTPPRWRRTSSRCSS